MKKTKFAVLFTALMVMLGLSSCLGDPDPYFTGTEIMKVKGFMGLYSFESAGKYTVEPTNAEAITSEINTEFAVVTYKYDTRTITQGASRIQGEILNLLPINDFGFTSGEMESNAPIHTVGATVNFFDKTNVFINLTYYYKDSSNAADLKTELDKHRFVIYKATAEEDPDVKDNTMVLYLNHIVADPEINDERLSAGTETRHFDLNYVLGGSEPETIIIKFKYSSKSTMDDAKESEIRINYKSIIDQYFGNNTNI